MTLPEPAAEVVDADGEVLEDLVLDAAAELLGVGALQVGSDRGVVRRCWAEAGAGGGRAE